MGEDQGQERTQLSDDPDRTAARASDAPEQAAVRRSDDPAQAASQLRAEIEDVREDLGDTAEALAAKTDVKARAREKAEELKRTAAAKKDDLLSSAGRSSSGDGGGSGVGATASSGLTRLRTTAEQNPVPTAALGALVGGFLLGRLTRRGP
jgi:hypothetical protein